jgi:UPF0755 protein
MHRRLGLLALLFIASLGAGAGWLNSQLTKPYRGHRPEKVFVDIPRGTSRWGIAGLLKRNDVIRNRAAFALFSDWHFRRPLQAGEYLFDHQVDSRDVFWKIAHGEIFVHIVTVPEGWTMYDIANQLEAQEVCSKQDFLAASRDTASISDLAPHAKTLEGFLFPSTYQFTRRTTCRQVAATMVRHFRAIWETLQVSRFPQLSSDITPEDAVTVASLVERETPSTQERPRVAGVFYNRLRKEIPLQCDATIQYALLLRGRPEGDVKPADLRVDSPYNTYEHRGLPPGPIANPGEAALKAALEPEPSEYLYFVANNQGGHFFSKTLQEHNRNVARLRRLLNDDAAQTIPSSDRN